MNSFDFRLGFDEMWETNTHGECPATDMMAVCDQIAAFCERRRIRLGVSLPRLHRSLLEYVWHRRRFSPLQISAPRRRFEVPEEWTGEKELIWRQWIAHVCDLTEWEEEVIQPVFGTEVRFWETASGTGWRQEILEFLPWWSLRTAEQLAEIDPTPYQDIGDVSSVPRKVVDPYILEHGSRRAKRQAAKEIGHT